MLPGPRQLVPAFACLLATLGLLVVAAAGSWAWRTGPVSLDPDSDYGHTEWHHCESVPMSQMDAETFAVCIDHAPWEAQPSWIDRKAQEFRRQGSSPEDALLTAQRMGAAAWAERHRSFLARFRETQAASASLARVFPGRAAPAVVALSILGAVLALLALLGRLRAMRSVSLRLTPHAVVWNGRRVRRIDIERCYVRDQEELVLEPARGPPLMTGPTAHDTEALQWVARAVQAELGSVRDERLEADAARSEHERMRRRRAEKH